MPELPTLTYRRMRTLAVRAAVAQALRRWGLWWLMALGLLAAVSNTPEVALAALAGVLAPLWWVSGQGGGVDGLLWAGVTLLYAALGWAWRCAWRAALWPTHWREVEASLPLPQEAVDRADLRLLAYVLVPWALWLSVAWGLLWSWQQGPAWAQAAWAALGLSLALALSLTAGQLNLRRWRRQAPSLWTGATRRAAARQSNTAWRLWHPGWALVLLALWRGCAPMSRNALSLGLLMPALALLGTAWQPIWVTAWLCGATVVALTCTSLTLRRLERELAALHAASTHLPLHSHTLRRWRRGVALWPVASLVLGLALTVASGALPLRPLPTLGLLLSLACAGGLETHWPIADPGHHASRWLLMLCVCLAWASELTPI